MARNKQNVISSLDVLAIATASAPAWIFLLGILHVHIDDFLSGKEVLDINTHVRANYLRNLFELTSFIATTAILLTAIWAFAFTKSQIREAEKARLASVYMQISAHWNSPRILDSKLRIRKIEHDYARLSKTPAIGVPPNYKPGDSVGIYLRNIMYELQENNLEEFSRHIAALSSLEELGMLCKKGYVDEEDILDFMASPIIKILGLFDEYVKSSQLKIRSNYENVLYLQEKALAFREKRIQELSKNGP